MDIETSHFLPDPLELFCGTVYPCGRLSKLLVHEKDINIIWKGPIANHSVVAILPSLRNIDLRAGLRVVAEWSYERQWEAHFSAQAQCFMTLVHLWVSMV